MRNRDPTLVIRTDSVPLNHAELTPEGYLIDKPIVTTCGVFDYHMPDGIRRELRLPEEVFNADSLASYEGKPVIITHNAGYVDTENVGAETVGTMLSPGEPDGDHVRAKVVIHEPEKLGELRGLSLGYKLELDPTPGTWNGEPYDAIQRKIHVNHLALVLKARAGETARLNLDGADNLNRRNKPMTPEELKGKFGKGGDITAEELKDPAKGDVNEDEGGEKSAEELLAVIETLKAEIEALKAKIDMTEANEDGDGDGDEDDKGDKPDLNTDGVDDMIRERIRLGRLGDQLRLDGLEELRPLDAKKKIVLAVTPKMNLDGKSAAYVNAAFDRAGDTLAARKSTDDQRESMFNMDSKSAVCSARDARANMISRQTKGGAE